MRDLTKFSPQQLGAYLMTLQPFDNPLTKCSPGEVSKRSYYPFPLHYLLCMLSYQDIRIESSFTYAQTQFPRHWMYFITSTQCNTLHM